MMGEQDSSYHMNPWSLEDSVVGRIDVKDAELCDNVVVDT